MILVTKGFFLTKPNEFLIHTHIYIHNKQRFTFISYIACEDLSFTLCLHSGEKKRRSGIRDAYSSSGWVDDGGDATPGCCASRETLVRSNRGRTRVCIDEYARTHARTHVHSSYKHRGVVHELLRVPSSTDLFFFFFFSPFFFHAPSSFFRTPRRIVQFTVPIRPWITFVHVETGFIEVVESFPMLLQPDDTALNNATIFNVAFSPLFIFLPSFLSRN